MKHVLLATGIYHPETHRGIARYAKEHGWLLDSSQAFRRSLPRSWDGDGILLNSFEAPGYEKIAVSSGKPTVYLGQVPDHLQLPGVDRDNQVEAEMAYAYFEQRGFRSFATYNDRVTEVHKALAGFAELCSNAPCREIRAIDAADCTQLLSHIAGELKQCALPVAVLARDDNAAVELLHACLQHGLSVPEQVAILGSRNDPLVCEAAPIPISSIAIDYGGIGYEAASQLDRLMAGEDVPVHTTELPPTQIVTRQSSDILAYPHRGLAAALGFIRQNYQRKLLVGEVAAAAGMSERGLFHAFQEHLGRTVREEILRLRLDHATRMLTATTEKINTIALESGFGDRRRLHAHFVRAYNATPKQYRLAKSSTSVSHPQAECGEDAWRPERGL